MKTILAAVQKRLETSAVSMNKKFAFANAIRDKFRQEGLRPGELLVSGARFSFTFIPIDGVSLFDDFREIIESFKLDYKKAKPNNVYAAKYIFDTGLTVAIAVPGPFNDKFACFIY